METAANCEKCEKGEKTEFAMVQSIRDRCPSDWHQYNCVNVFVTSRLVRLHNQTLVDNLYILEALIWLAPGNDTADTWTAEWQKKSAGLKTRTWNRGHNDKSQQDNQTLQTFVHYDIPLA